MTNQSKQSCDPQRIDDYLNERLDNRQQDEFEFHLSNCKKCQLETQRLAAEPETWDHAVAILGEHYSTRIDSTSNADDNGVRSPQVQSVLDSLEPTDDPQMLGRINDYEIIGVVGVGGMGAVLKGFDRSLRRVVAIKVMASYLAGSGSARQRFQREAQAAAAITHENVIDIYGVSEANGLPYLVMPYARGPSLQSRIDEGGPLSLAEVLRIGRQIAAGLTAAHEQGLVHRDIKPANIMLNEGIERLLITDFGVARAMDDASMTRTGVIAGTPQYMSPEQARGESVDYRSDLFSLGSILYTACTGRPPFRSEAAYGILRRITDADPRPIREINPDIPDWFCVVVKRLMAKHPADRYQDAAEVSVLLENCLAHLHQPTQVALPQCVTATSPPDASGSSSARVHGGDKSVRSSRFSLTGVLIMVFSLLLTGASFVAFQMTDHVPIAGQWSGHDWKDVSISSVEEATGWYTGSFRDASGQRGALQLEWSRMHRAYNGRWKMGDQQSGSITLRAGNPGELRGAVAIDSDSKVVSNAPRVRQFEWTRSAVSDSRPVNSNVTKRIGRASRNIESPVEGMIQTWGRGIYENSRVKKGDLIARISPSADSSIVRSAEQQAVSERLVTALEAQLKASLASLNDAKALVLSQQRLLEQYEQVEQKNIDAAKAAVVSAENMVEAEGHQVAERIAARDQVSIGFERQKSLYEERLTSELQMQQASAKLREMEASVAKSKTHLRAAEDNLTAKKKEQVASQQKAKSDIEHTRALCAAAESRLAKAQAEVARSEADLAKAVQELSLLKEKRTATGSVTIIAPADGYIVGITVRQRLSKGDRICELVQDSTDVRTQLNIERAQTDAGGRMREITSPSDGFRGMIHPGIAVPSVQGTFGSVSDLSRRLRESREMAESLELHLRTKGEELRSETEEYEAAKRRITELETQRRSDESEFAEKGLKELELLQLQLPSLELRRDRATAVVSGARQRLEALKSTRAEAEAERETIINLLKSQLLAAEKRLEVQDSLARSVRLRFEQGDKAMDDVLRAEEPLSYTRASMQQLQLLLEMYHMLDSGKHSKSPKAVEPVRKQ